jgi:hypothetical protein
VVGLTLTPSAIADRRSGWSALLLDVLFGGIAVAGRASVAQAVRHEYHQTNHCIVNQRLQLDTRGENWCLPTG